ncbi:unnamed protein product [Prunus armeniaca]|uniref:Uncharacterized protein n=1 Tax=Prunus armeniaca TaxID=36596 RepID=A0A6J5TN45_PRUAR|nr:unnamed protein product [Prunus armeniaca]
MTWGSPLSSKSSQDMKLMSQGVILSVKVNPKHGTHMSHEASSNSQGEVKIFNGSYCYSKAMGDVTSFLKDAFSLKCDEVMNISKPAIQVRG